MFGLDDIIGEGMKIIDKFIPDPQAKMNAQIEMMKITQADKFKEIDAALQEQQMQADINKQEAINESVFVSGWRPFIGWICGAAFGLQFVVFPVSVFALGFFKITTAMPVLPMEALMTVLLGMLGLGGMRSWEKVQRGKTGS